METDRTEQHNLAAKLPGKVAEMNQMYNEWAASNHVLPWNEVQKLYLGKRENKQN